MSISTCYVCLVLYLCHSAFYAGGRSRTGHLTSTRPDRQPAPVDPTGFHLCGTKCSTEFAPRATPRSAANDHRSSDDDAVRYALPVLCMTSRTCARNRPGKGNASGVFTQRYSPGGEVLLGVAPKGIATPLLPVRKPHVTQHTA